MCRTLCGVLLVPEAWGVQFATDIPEGDASLVQLDTVTSSDIFGWKRERIEVHMKVRQVRSRLVLRVRQELKDMNCKGWTNGQSKSSL